MAKRVKFDFIKGSEVREIGDKKEPKPSFGSSQDVIAQMAASIAKHRGVFESRTKESVFLLKKEVTLAVADEIAKHSAYNSEDLLAERKNANFGTGYSLSAGAFTQTELPLAEILNNVRERLTS